LSLLTALWANPIKKRRRHHHHHEDKQQQKAESKGNLSMGADMTRSVSPPTAKQKMK